MSYTSTNASDAFLRRNPWMKQAVVSEPLKGVVNGINRRFLLQTSPALSGTISVISMDGSAVSTDSVDEDAGVVVVATAPTESLFASFTHCVLTSAQLADLFTEGFVMMESLWTRGYYIYSAAISSDSASAVDPVIGDSTFSQRPPQYNLLVECMNLSWALGAQSEAAFNAIQVRESQSAGVNVDRTKQPAAMDSLVEQARARVLAALEEARVDAGASWLDASGLAIPGASDPYPNEWKTLKPVSVS